MQGRFIVFEGIDGSGKSSALARTAAALKADGVPVWVTREETDSPIGAQVRKSIRDQEDPLATTFLFLADRAQHVPQIEAHLAAGTHVLCDRFLASTLAYQGVTLAGRMPDPVAWLRGLHADWCRIPDRTLWFDAPADVCVARTEARGATTPYEKTAFLERVAEAYRAQVDGSWTVLDATRDLDSVAEEALAVVRSIIG